MNEIILLKELKIKHNRMNVSARQTSGQKW